MKDSSGFQLAEEAPKMKNLENDSKALCAAIALMMMAIFALNIFSFLFGYFVLVSINGYYETWLNYKRVVSVFRMLSYVLLIIVMILLVVAFIVSCINKDPAGIPGALVLLALTILEFIYTKKASDATEALYSNLKVDFSPDKPFPDRSNVTFFFSPRCVACYVVLC